MMHEIFIDANKMKLKIYILPQTISVIYSFDYKLLGVKYIFLASIYFASINILLCIMQQKVHLQIELRNHILDSLVI